MISRREILLYETSSNYFLVHFGAQLAVHSWLNIRIGLASRWRQCVLSGETEIDMQINGVKGDISLAFLVYSTVYKYSPFYGLDR